MKRCDGMTTPTDTEPSENGIIHHQPSGVVTTMMSPPVGPSSRRNVSKCANAAERFSSGSRMRPPTLRDSSASRPVASTTTRAATSRGVASPASFTRTPVARRPVASNSTSSTRASSNTAAPLRRALSSRMRSKSARLTWKALGCRSSMPSTKRTIRDAVGAVVIEPRTELGLHVARQLGQHAEALEQRHVPGQQRFADVEARKALALEHGDGEALADEQRGEGRAGRAAAADDGIDGGGDGGRRSACVMCSSGGGWRSAGRGRRERTRWTRRTARGPAHSRPGRRDRSGSTRACWPARRAVNGTTSPRENCSSVAVATGTRRPTPPPLMQANMRSDTKYASRPLSVRALTPGVSSSSASSAALRGGTCGIGGHRHGSRIRSTVQPSEAVRRSFATATGATSRGSTPFFTAVISARIEIAISGGVRLPM